MSLFPFFFNRNRGNLRPARTFVKKVISKCDNFFWRLNRKEKLFHKVICSGCTFLYLMDFKLSQSIFYNDLSPFSLHCRNIPDTITTIAIL